MSSPSPIYNHRAMKSIHDRKEIYKKIERFLKSLKKDACLSISTPGEYTIDDKVQLFRRIGSESSFGITYVCKALDDDVDKFACKIQINDKSSKLETYILKNITRFALEKNNIHLPLMFCNIVCKNVPRDDDRFPRVLANADKKARSYSVTFNEVADGDFKRFIKKRDLSAELWHNAIEQIFMCIASFHSIGLMHLDSHYGNFLYHKIKPGGCFHYKINNTDFYIPNLGYLWVIWDFGVSGPIYRNMDYLQDYNLFVLFMRKDDPSQLTDRFTRKFKMDLNDVDERGRRTKIGSSHRNYGHVPNSIEIPDSIVQLEQYIWKKSGEDDFVSREVVDNKIDEGMWLRSMMDNGMMFSRSPIGDVIVTTRIDFQPFDGLVLDRSKFFLSSIPASYL